jgi:small subunit ribosomal protein S21
MEMEGTMGIIRRTRYYEKPTQQRRRYAFEASKAIYNEDMDRKIRFLLRKNRIDQYPGQIIT